LTKYYLTEEECLFIESIAQLNWFLISVVYTFVQQEEGLNK